MRKRLAFIWDFSVSELEKASWRDGLNQALQILAYEHGVDVRVIQHDNPDAIWAEIKEWQPTHILGWGSLDRPSFSGLEQFDIPRGLCFAGGPRQHPNSEVFDTIFVENTHYLEDFKEQGVNAVLAFGVNDLFFRPLETAKHWKAVYPASFAAWKRHELFYDAVGEKGLAIGKISEHEKYIFKDGIAAGVCVLPPVPYEVLPMIYNQSEFALITASEVGGSQRAVLEAMACNIPPVVMSDAPQNVEYVKEAGFGLIVEPDVESIKKALRSEPQKTGGRGYIESKWTAKHYAQQIYENLLAD